MVITMAEAAGRCSMVSICIGTSISAESVKLTAARRTMPTVPAPLSPCSQMRGAPPQEDSADGVEHGRRWPKR